MYMVNALGLMFLSSKDSQLLVWLEAIGLFQLFRAVSGRDALQQEAKLYGLVLPPGGGGIS